MNELMQKLADYHVALEAEKHLAEPAKRGAIGRLSTKPRLKRVIVAGESGEY